MARRKKAGELKESEVECGYCNAIIPEDAVRCPSCGKLFSAAKKMAAFAVVVIIVLAGLSYFAYTEYFNSHEPGTNDLNPIDTDGDGFYDAEEEASGTDPNNANDYPDTAPTGNTIVIELKTEDAPNTCANFEKYVNDRFFDGLIFHRVIDNFMIQGGGFNQDLSQKTATYAPINLEISPNLRHTDGAVAMARTTDPNSATSQFYICDGVQSNLDDQYAVFGYVTSGMEHVRAISGVQTGTENGMSDVPVSDVIIQSARLSTIGGKTYVTLIVSY